MLKSVVNDLLSRHEKTKIKVKDWILKDLENSEIPTEVEVSKEAEPSRQLFDS